jgi:hypothetical protein
MIRFDCHHHQPEGQEFYTWLHFVSQRYHDLSLTEAPGKNFVLHMILNVIASLKDQATLLEHFQISRENTCKTILLSWEYTC